MIKLTTTLSLALLSLTSNLTYASSDAPYELLAGTWQSNQNAATFSFDRSGGYTANEVVSFFDYNNAKTTCFMKEKGNYYVYAYDTNSNGVITRYVLNAVNTEVSMLPTGNDNPEACQKIISEYAHAKFDLELFMQNPTTFSFSDRNHPKEVFNKIG